MSKSQLFRLRIQKAKGELELPWALKDWSYEAMKQQQSNGQVSQSYPNNVGPLVKVLAEWEDREGAMAAIMPHEWADLHASVTQACIYQSPRELRRAHAAALEENAKLRKHAEALAHSISKGHSPDYLYWLAKQYRADFQKEGS